MNWGMKQLWLLLFCGVLTTSCWAWNELGHLVIANLAYQQLTPTAKNAVDHLVSVFTEEYPKVNTFPLLADWPDQLHAEKIELYSRWHYIDTAFSQDGTPLKNFVSEDNAVWAVNTLEPSLNYSGTTLYQRAQTLAFLSHIVSDLHQPLHTVTYLSANHPNGDQGGNTYMVIYQGQSIRLHQLWDEGVGLFAGAFSADQVDQLTHQIMNDYPATYFGDLINDKNPTDWAQSGFTLARDVAYNTPENQAVSSKYVSAGISVAEQQAALAGYRLAAMLNQVFSTGWGGEYDKSAK